MKMLFLFFSLFILGCATPAVQTNALLAAPGDLPSHHKIQNVDFVDQSAGHCGPATLTMAMRWAGHEISVVEVAEQVFTPGAQGSFQSDLISASRRQGLMAVPIRNLDSLLQEVASGHPVIVFENLGLSWAPQWHYALVLGFNLQKPEVIMHSGHTAYYHWDMRKFERSWMLGDYWGLVILPAGELAASADELTQVGAAVGLELAQKNKESEKSYQKILEKWPNSLVALIGLANLAHKNKDQKKAVRLLRRAVDAHPKSEAAKHNLLIAEQSLVK